MALPEKNYYTLDEISARWACIDFDRSSFLDLAQKDLLVFSTYRREIGSYREVTETKIIRTKNVPFNFKAEGYQGNAIQYLRAEDARRVLEAMPGQEVAVPGLYSLPARTRESGTAYSPQIYLTAEDLGISLVEKNRFESEHGYNSVTAKLARLWGWAKEKSNLKMLSWLTIGIGAVVGATWTVLKFFYKCS